MSTLEQVAHPDSSSSGTTTRDSAASNPGQIERVIAPSRGWVAIDWKELYQSRELFDTLVLRDIRIRYKQTVFGVAWAILQPLATMLVFTLVFGNFHDVRPDNAPYPLFVLAGLIPWTFFNSAVSAAGTSLLAQQQLLTKIYFPRLFVPASTVGAYLVDMGIGLLLYFLLLPYYGRGVSLNVIALPLVVLLTFAAAFGLGLLFASMTIMFRDLRFIIPFLMQLMMFASPLFYQSTKLPLTVQRLVAFNPVTGIISAFRWCLMGEPLNIMALVFAIVVTLVIVVFGLFFFRKTERYFADLL